MVFSSWVEAYVSISRLTTFLSAKELQADAVQRVPMAVSASSGEDLISVVDGQFSWTARQPDPTLININLSVKKGELVAVVGRVGSGKSSLLSGSVPSYCF